jgi:hypothetical protein
MIPGPAPAAPALLAVGNSVTQATQVADDQTFTALLQRRMDMPVLNVGHDAQAIADNVLIAPYRLKNHDVAWTIVQFIPLDFEDTPPRDRNARFKTINGQLEVELPRFGRGRIAPLRKRVALVNMGLLRLAVLLDTPMPPLFRAADPRPEPVRRYGPVETHLDAIRNAYERRVTMFFVPDFFPPATEAEKRFEAWCAERQVSCVNLRDVFADFERRGRAPVGFANSRFGFGHLNPEGHAAAADLLAIELERLRKRDLF